MAKLGPLAKRDSCTEVRQFLERFTIHFCLVSVAVLAGTEVVVGAAMLGAVVAIGADVLDAVGAVGVAVTLLILLLLALLPFGRCPSKGVCLSKLLKLYKYLLLFLIRHLNLSICLVFILLCLCSLILLMKCIHLMMLYSKVGSLAGLCYAHTCIGFYLSF